MFSPHSTPRTARRHVACAAVIGVVLSLSPIAPGGAAVADAPAAAFVGLARGSAGEAVRSVQQALVNQGIAVPGGVDGVFGPATETALRTFQEREGLAVTGAVDGATEIALGLATSPLLGLTQGTRGAAVAQMQRALIASGLDPAGGDDGIFGPATSAALKSFQTAQGLSPTGRVDAATAAALEAVTASGAGSGTGTEAGGSEDPPEPDPAPSVATSADLVGLSIGSRGDAVKRLQRLIMATGIDLVGGDDGIFGALTANALRSFQTAKGLEASGRADEATVAGLEHAEAAETADDPGPDAGEPAATSPLLGLKLGSVGNAAAQLQQALLDAGIHVRGGADGIFGPVTQSALQDYQTSRGLEATGRVDEATLAALTSSATPQGAIKPQAPVSPMFGLAYGALGTAVAQLQQALMDAGVTVRGGADGIFGPATTNALEAFQASHGLSATGTVDEATIAALADPIVPVSEPAPAAGDVGGYAVYGEKGDRVRTLQQALVDAGISLRGGVDGDFGSGTSAAVMEFQRQQGLSVTGKVDDATAGALGIGREVEPVAPDPATVSISAFPVQGTCYFNDSYGYARSGGRTHLGVDIMAAEGKLLYAVADGTITKVYSDHPGSLAGNGVRLTAPDGTYFFYAHMSELAEGIGVGSTVKAGQILGLLGSTGNAGAPHLHLEIHPGGGSAINPYPIVKAIDGCGNTTPLPQP